LAAEKELTSRDIAGACKKNIRARMYTAIKGFLKLTTFFFITISLHSEQGS
jgi:hypothetical protein